jgi:hypothetical protein
MGEVTAIALKLSKQPSFVRLLLATQAPAKSPTTNPVHSQSN